ncbi:MAG: serine/threonine protein kinase [Actinomycetales bacterium]|nr:serine/threonine protein kinase [Actinomycetales bacterium]
MSTQGGVPHPVGPQIDGYEPSEQVGRGAFGSVWRARQVAQDRYVAIKVFDAGIADDAARHRFQREAAITGRLTGHPNIVTVLDSGFLDDGRPYLSMTYCERGSLAGMLHAGPLPAQDVARIGVKIAGALHTAHQHDVLHRDLKPENVLVTAFGEPALADFGIATVAGVSATGLTAAYSPSHAAPEVLRGEPASVASDVYGLGSTLYQLLAGRPAFAHTGDTGLAVFVDDVLHSPPAELPPEVPEPLRRVVAAAMAKDPADRPASAAAFGELLQRAQRDSGLPVTEMIVGSAAPPAAPGPAPAAATTVGARTVRPAAGAAATGATIAPPAFTGHAAPVGGEATVAGGRDRDANPDAAATPPRRRSRTGVLVAVVTLAVLLAGGGVAVAVLRPWQGTVGAEPIPTSDTSTTSEQSTATSTPTPTETATPTPTETATPSPEPSAESATPTATATVTVAPTPKLTLKPPLPSIVAIAPTAPVTTYAAGHGAGTIAVVWSESTSSFTSVYNIYRSTSTTGPWTVVAQVPRDDTTQCGIDFPHCYFDEPPSGTSCYEITAMTEGFVESQPGPVACALRP